MKSDSTYFKPTLREAYILTERGFASSSEWQDSAKEDPSFEAGDDYYL